jgi:hypothetical protein
MSDEEEDETSISSGRRSKSSRPAERRSSETVAQDPLASTQIFRQRIEEEKRLSAARSLLDDHLLKV